MVVGGVYLRLFIQQPNWVLRKPKEFLIAILERFDQLAQTPSPDVSSLEVGLGTYLLLYTRGDLLVLVSDDTRSHQLVLVSGDTKGHLLVLVSGDTRSHLLVLVSGDTRGHQLVLVSGDTRGHLLVLVSGDHSCPPLPRVTRWRW